MEVKYFTTESGCSCKDRQYRHRTCKHMLRLREAAELLEAQAVHNAMVDINGGTPMPHASNEWTDHRTSRAINICTYRWNPWT